MKGLPLGLLSTAAYLRQCSGVTPSVIDLANSKTQALRERHLRSLWSGPTPLIVGITCTTPTYTYAIGVAEELKRVWPDSFVLLGGVHASYCYASILENHPEVDGVCRGEGERTLLHLNEALNGCRDLGAVDNLSFRRNGALVHNTPGSDLPNLDAIPCDYDSFISRDEYRAEMFGLESKSTSTIVARGCPFRCAFCSEARRFGGAFRMRSVRHVVNEVSRLQELGFLDIYFEDDVFTLNKKWVFELCAELRRQRLEMSWNCETRADLVEVALLEAMRDAGCRNIFFGLESLRDDTLRRIGRGMTVRHYEEALRICHNLGIETFCSLQIGLPGEGETEILESIRAASKLPIDQVGIAFTSAYPGTAIFEDCGFPLDIYERYCEPAEVTDWFATRVGHGINSIRPSFLDWNAYGEGMLMHDLPRMQKYFEWCQDAFHNLWTPLEEVRPACDWSEQGASHSTERSEQVLNARE
jgi:anaerobic magnesium-protoporphyrin IX monomethyl ester cyclase